MTKYEWETELKRNLFKLSKDEQLEIFDYYDELFNENIERGKTEAQVIKEFGNPFDVANKILGEYGVASEGSALQRSSTKNDEGQPMQPPFSISQGNQNTVSPSNEGIGGRSANPPIGSSSAWQNQNNFSANPSIRQNSNPNGSQAATLAPAGQGVGWTNAPYGQSQQLSPPAKNQNQQGYLAAFNQNPIANNQQSAANSQNHMPNNQQHGAYNQNPIANNQQSATYSQNHMPNNQQTGAYNQNPMAFNQKSAAYIQNPMTNNQPTAAINQNQQTGPAPSIPNEESKKLKRRKFSFTKFVFLFIPSVIVFAILLSLAAAFITVAFSFSIIGIVMIVGGMVQAVISAIFFLPTMPAAGLAQLGASMILVGLGILLVIPMFKLFIMLCKALFKLMKKLFFVLFFTKKEQK